MSDQNQAVVEHLDPVQRLSRDLRDAARSMTRDEVRFLVDMYYAMQDQRLRCSNQVRALSAANTPHATLQWFADQHERLEAQVRRALAVYADAHPLGEWAQGIVGIGPVIAAGLIAYVDIERCPTVGHLWSFAGLYDGAVWLGTDAANRVLRALVSSDDTVDVAMFLEIARRMGADPKWLARRVYRIVAGQDLPFRGLGRMDPEGYVRHTLHGMVVTKKAIVDAVARRPWNAGLKVLCWKIGESFVKTSNNPNSYYGRIYAARKELERQRNESGQLAEKAKATLQRHPRHKQRKIYEQGKLPDGHIHARAKRYAVKLFLAHWHEVAYELHFGRKPPLPYPIAHGGHAHKIEPPQSQRGSNDAAEDSSGDLS